MNVDARVRQRGLEALELKGAVENVYFVPTFEEIADVSLNDEVLVVGQVRDTELLRSHVVCGLGRFPNPHESRPEAPVAAAPSADPPSNPLFVGIMSSPAQVADMRSWLGR